MDVTVTWPVVEAMNSVPGLELVKSVTCRGSGEFILFFNWSVNMFQTLAIRERGDGAGAAIAALDGETGGETRSDLRGISNSWGYSLTSDTMSQSELWEIANYTIKPRLNRVNGVSMVVLQGGQVPEFEIQPEPARLAQAQVTVPGILDAVAKTNMVDSPGLIENNHELSLTLVTGQAKDPSEIANIVVRATPAGVPVRIGDIATVHPSVMPVYTMVTANGKPAVLLSIFRQPDGNTVAVADASQEELAQIRKTLPAGVKIETFYDQSTLVRDSIDSVRDATLIGLALAAIILVLFLRDWGSSLVAALVIPATIAITLIVMRMIGESFNLMTLGGLAAAVGLIIDDAIVVVENIVLHRDLGQSRGEAIRSALREIRVPLVGSTIAPIVVFLPLISITGVTGTFFRALAVTVGTALLTSLALALTWTPTLSYFLLRRKSAHVHSADEAPTGFMGRVNTAYDRALRFVLAYPLALAAGSVILIAASALCYRALGSDLLPAMDEGGFILDYLMPAGSSQEDTNTVLLGVEKILSSTGEVESTSRRTGLQLGLAAVTEANRGDFTVRVEAQTRPGY